MRTSGIFTTHKFHIQDAKFDETFYLIPFGDVHKGSPMHDKTHWKEWCKWAKTKKNAYFLGMGDYVDIGSTSERDILGSNKLHESTLHTLDELYLGKCLDIVKDIEFMKGKLIGMLDGNHDARFQSGITVSQKICDMMQTKWLGVATMIRVQIETKSKTRQTLDIFAHHGKGSGMLVGSGLNAVEKMQNIAVADIYLMGDNHQKSLAYTDKYYLSQFNSSGEAKLKKRKQLYARTGSFLLGYKENCASYVTDALLVPTNLGTIKIQVTPRITAERIDKKRIRETKLDIHASL